MKSSVELIPLDDPEVGDVVDEIVAAGGAMTPELEARFDFYLRTRDGILDMARRAKELLKWCETNKAWRDRLREMEKVREAAADAVKAKLTVAFERMPTKEMIRGARNERVWYVNPREGGSLDPGVEFEEVSIRGCTKAEKDKLVAAGIDEMFFEPQAVWKLNTKMLQDYLANGGKAGTAKLIPYRGHVRIDIPGL
ncbi:MAG TPA: hypothetical protein VFB99_03845 [Vicinamibacterales bacterium]|nr:hypothetical protein [Vicinamibacterales bacterium]